MNASPILALIPALFCLSLPACNVHHEEHQHEEHHKIVVTSPIAKDIVITEQYVCQIRSQNHIEVCPLVGGRLEIISVKEGQTVQKGEPMFKILPTIYQLKLDAEMAKVRLEGLTLNYTKKLHEQKVVSASEVALQEAKLAEAQAMADRTKAEVEFTLVRAPFDGIIDRLPKQLGSTVKEGEILTTLSDNSAVWVYYNVPEVRYLAYMANRTQDKEAPRIELMLANGNKFPQHCKTTMLMGEVNKETGNMPFRADFQNPDRLLRHGQTGNILLHRTLKKATVIPQRATFEILDKQYVKVVGKDDVVHQREIVIQSELEDIFVVKSGLEIGDRIVLDGIRQVHEGEKVEYEFHPPEEVLRNQKKPAQ